MQLAETPAWRYYTGVDPRYAVAVSDLRAMSQKRLPSFAFEYLEVGSQDEAALLREQDAYVSTSVAERKRFAR